jgi:predicted nucleic acid-binding protein
MIALDTSVLIAHLDPDHPHHRAATDVLLQGAPGQMLVHTITLAEVLIGGVRIGQGLSMRRDIHAAGIGIAPHDEEEPLRLAELRATTGLTLPDCCVIDVAIRNQATLASFAKPLAVQALKRGLTLAGYHS